MLNIQKVVSYNIKLHRKNKGLTQEKLAEIVNVSGSYIGYLERGQKNPSLDLLANIAHALEVDPADLLTFPKEKINLNLHKLITILNSSDPESINFMLEVADAYFRSLKKNN